MFFYVFHVMKILWNLDLKKKPLYWKIKKVTYLKSSDDEQGVDVMDPNLLSDLVQMFAGKSSSIKKGNISTIKQCPTSFLFSWCFYWVMVRWEAPEISFLRPALIGLKTVTSSLIISTTTFILFSSDPFDKFDLKVFLPVFMTSGTQVLTVLSEEKLSKEKWVWIFLFLTSFEMFSLKKKKKITQFTWKKEKIPPKKWGENEGIFENYGTFFTSSQVIDSIQR